jgi:hypothetical protein
METWKECRIQFSKTVKFNSSITYLTYSVYLTVYLVNLPEQFT